MRPLDKRAAAPAIPIDVAPDVAAGADGYTQERLRGYDRVVLELSNDYIWRCPSRELLALYDAHVSTNHLDVGVGTGYFLDSCRFPAPSPRITLLDLNENCLAYTCERIRRYAPRTRIANILDPLPAELGPFDSIGLNYVLHCIPGPMARKQAALANLRRLLSERGVLFGATILGRGPQHGWAARGLIHLYNRTRWFANRDDDQAGLEAALRSQFQQVSVRILGAVALFVARGPRPDGAHSSHSSGAAGPMG